nr:HK97 family phage prohead protease [Paenibacillus sp. FSL R7-0337]
MGGYVVKFNQRSQLIWGEFYERVAAGAFSRSLQENVIKAFWNHRSDFVLGSTKPGTLRLLEDDVGLSFEFDLPNNTDSEVSQRSID